MLGSNPARNGRTPDRSPGIALTTSKPATNEGFRLRLRPGVPTARTFYPGTDSLQMLWAILRGHAPRTLRHPWLSKACAVLLLVATLPACGCNHPLSAARTVTSTRSRISVLAGGDVIAQRAVRLAAQQTNGGGLAGWESLLTHLQPLLQHVDLRFCNLESPILLNAPLARPEPGKEFPKFYGPTDLVGSLRNIGFNVVSVANNHAHDMGVGGVQQTRSAVRAAGLVPVGYTRKGIPQIPVLRLGAWKVSFIGATTKMNESMPQGFTRWDVFEVDVNHPEPLLAAVRKAAKKGPVFVSLHGGVQWGLSPDPAFRRLGYALCDNGATLVLCQHAHVAQAVEVHVTPDGRRCLIAWCLGNLCAVERRPVGNLGMLVHVVLDADAAHRLGVVAASWEPTWSLQDDGHVTIVPLDNGSVLARRARALAACRAALRAAEKRIGPRQIFGTANR